MTLKQATGFLTITIILYACGNHSDNSYLQQVQSVEEMERAQPTNFLSVSGTYNENILGTKVKVKGTIRNNATVATYKDVQVRVTYYSKTQAVLAEKDYVVYDYFQPHSEKSFDLKIDNEKAMESIGLAVINALPN